MERSEIEETLEAAEAIAADAAAVLMTGYRSHAEVRKKGAIDLVTDFDLRSEELIRIRLASTFPGHHVVAEEGKDEWPPETALAWYVDPLDGTTNFAHGHPFFCVSMGLYRGDEGLAGVIAAPALELTWTAGRGLGAFRNGAPCHVSTTDALSEALCATGFPYDKWTNPDHNEAELGAFLRRTRGVRRCGSAALDLALVADGTYDLYWEQRLSAWDMCAGAVMVAEAGGRLSDYEGGPADPRTGWLVASNGAVHEAAIEVLKGVRQTL
jgi:myo-inositol-1(or 4)-monophosphatase